MIYFFVFLESRDCCMSLPHGAMGFSAVYDCTWYFLIILTIFAVCLQKIYSFKCKCFIPLILLRPLSMESQPQNTEFRNTPKFYRFLQQHIKYTSSDCFHSYIVVKAIAQFEDVRQKSMCLSRIHYSSDQKYVNDSLGT